MRTYQLFLTIIFKIEMIIVTAGSMIEDTEIQIGVSEVNGV